MKPLAYPLALLSAFAVLALPAVAQTAPAEQAWPRATPAAQGLAVEPLAALQQRIVQGDFGNTDHLVVIQDGKLVLDERFERDYVEISRGKRTALGCGTDACGDGAPATPFNYLDPNTHPYWRGRDVHTLQSVTKSVTATLFGVALARGELASLDAPLVSFFEDYDLSGLDARTRRATLKDLLTMRTGIEWHESDRPLDETNTTYQLEHADDWIRFTLAQPADAAPGEKWVYNSGGSQLMSQVLYAATGEHADQYARAHLFRPLGIADFYWKRTPTGHPDTEGGLFLGALDLAKIGQLYLDDGVWRGQRILPAGWAREAAGRHVQHVAPDNTNSPGYGYQWWRYDRRGVEVWAGNGFGGQFLLIVPEERLVGVVNSWNVFGTPAAGILGPFIDALLDAAGVPAT